VLLSNKGSEAGLVPNWKVFLHEQKLEETRREVSVDGEVEDNLQETDC
jgi:hypothetical protein